MRSPVTGVPDVSSCANPQCNATFNRLGEGKLMIFPIDDATEWGLPKEAKQKAIWLCRECASHMYVRLDRRRHVVQLVRHERSHEAPKAA